MFSRAKHQWLNVFSINVLLNTFNPKREQKVVTGLAFSFPFKS